MNGYYPRVIDQLKKHGFIFIRQGKGSHELWGKGSLAVTVPFNCNSKFTANGIMKDAGIRHRF
ncbi:HicA toxin of toxin-antitoxin [Nitrosospira sp. Nl5]|uniref:type II toxin-antitoxin system HicA family toxin n=1 Tax=Nitrosospira sp. Nl5 TaxID=200120 RepID=UPI00088F8696|nr:HicA toxin of toxin-antitoxin [Nitrosospira sp. Nl5]